MISPVRLLVSVRNLPEAQLVLAAGIAILDVKNPDAGSLGRASPEALLQILNQTRSPNFASEMSAAWGELQDWEEGRSEAVPDGLSYVKLGLSGMRERSDWKEHWLHVRRQLCGTDQAEGSRPRWIAVAYVDDVRSNSPPVAEVVANAIEHQCAGVLFDTCLKSGGGLLDFLPARQLAEFNNELRTAGLMGIAAGQVRLLDLRLLADCGCDVIAVRSAACRQGDRTAALDPAALRMLVATIDAINAERSKHVPAISIAEAPSLDAFT